MRDFSGDHRWLSINTATIRKSNGADLPLPAIIDACARRGIRAISPWRDQVAAAGLADVSKLVKQHGLALSGYCRGGMFPAADEAGVQAGPDDNRRAGGEGRGLGATRLVVGGGGLPGAPAGPAPPKGIRPGRAPGRGGLPRLLG